jgi:hypothetical protein
MIAISVAQVSGPRDALAELGYLDADPARADPADVDALSFRGVFHLLTGDLGRAVSDMTASFKMVRRAPPSSWVCAPTATWHWPSTWPATGTTCC